MSVVASDEDPHPLVTTEAAMCGLPVLVSDQTGVWGDHDILRHGQNGFVYRCGDTEQLAGFMQQLLDDPALRERMGQRSRELSREQSAERAAGIIRDVVRSLGRPGRLATGVSGG
jgi:glycosyltransferase involved in cell wall biosynthesis